MENANNIPNFVQMGKDLLTDTSRYAAVESIKFFTDSFTKGGFTDTSFTAWAPARYPMAGNRTMYKSGKLMRSFKKKEATMQRVVIENYSEYSEIHNEGGYITVTAQMKKYFWAKYIEFEGKTVYSIKKRAKANTKSNRTLSAKAAFCKAMALKKVGSKIKIPKCQFMGESKTMMANFETWYAGKVEIVFKQHLNNQ